MSDESQNPWTPTQPEAKAEMLRRLADLLEKGDLSPDAVLVQQDANGQTKVQLVEVKSSRRPAHKPAAPFSSVRQTTINSLNDLGVPSSPREISDYAFARYGEEVPAR